MTKQSRDNKSPPMKVEFKGQIPEAVSRVFETFSGLLCDIMENLRLRIQNANRRLSEAIKREVRKERNKKSPRGDNYISRGNCFK